MSDDKDRDPAERDGSRRDFLERVAVGTALVGVGLSAPAQADEKASRNFTVAVAVTVNGVKRELKIEPRVTLLDALRESLELSGTKKGCDHGQCGACTVLVAGKRVNSCLTLAVTCAGKAVTTVEGLAKGDDLHPMQAAFVKHDAFQCGYCTPGQICSAVGLIGEGRAKTDDDVREQMSGNLCRCGAYPNILAAVREVQKAGGDKR